MHYHALFEPAEEGGFIITVPDFSWGVSEGDTEEEAREMAVALLKTLIQEHIRQGEDIPPPALRKGKKFRAIALPPLDGIKTELYMAFKASGMSKAELARRLGIPKTIVDRLFDLKHRTRLEQLDAACRVLGKQIEIRVRDAA